MAKFALPFLLHRHPQLHLPIEDLAAVSALLFGAIHGEICIANQQLRRIVFLSRHCCAQTRHRVDPMAKYVEGPIQLGEHALGNRLHVGRGGNVLHQDSELVAAKSGRRILGSQNGPQPLRHSQQQHVPGRVPQRVVDLLEIIQVQKQNTASLVAAPGAPAQSQLQAIVEQRPVGQAGQHVVHGVVLQFGLNLLALADVAVSHHMARDPAIDHHSERC